MDRRRGGLREAAQGGRAGPGWSVSLLQLRVVRAFKSTLEDLEERLSAHSAAGLRSRLRPPPDMAYIDDERAETTIF